jgi:hypothetical protein
LIALAASWLAFFGHPVQTLAETMPPSSIPDMCFATELIVTGEHLGEGKIRVDQVLLGKLPTNIKEQTITVKAVAKLAKTTSNIFKESKSVTTNKLALFLKKNDQGEFAPYLAHQENAAPGAIWFTEDACWGYREFFSGTFELMPSHAGEVQRDLPHGKTALLAEIAKSVKTRQDWEQVLQIKDRAQRAERMAVYLLPQTAPPGYKMHVLNLPKLIGDIGTPAVPAVIAALNRAKLKENSYDLYLILLTLHEAVGDSKNYANALRPALPKMLELLKHPNSNYSSFLPRVMERFVEDKEAITAVRPLLADPSWEVRGYAALTLAAMDDLSSSDAIVNKFKESLTAKAGRDVVRNLFTAIVRLDPVRARVVLDDIQDATTRTEFQKLLPQEK